MSQSPSPVPDNEKVYELHLQSGHVLSYVINECLTGPIVIFNHGLPGHKDVGFQRDAARYLAENGLAQSVRYDLRRDTKQWDKTKSRKGGLGQLAQMKSFADVSFQDHTMDLGSLLREENVGSRKRPFILAGQSFGAALDVYAAQAEGFRKVDGLYLTNPMSTMGTKRSLLSGLGLLKGFEGFPDRDAMETYVTSLNCFIRVVYDLNDSINKPRENAQLFPMWNQHVQTSGHQGVGHDFITPSAREVYRNGLIGLISALK